MALGAWLLLRPDRDDDDLPPVPPAPTGAAGATDAGMGLGPVRPPTDRRSDRDAGDTGRDRSDAIDARRRRSADADATDADTTTVQPTTDAGDGGRRDRVRPRRPRPGTCPRRPCPASRSRTSTGHDHRPRNQRHRHRHLVGPGVFGVLLIWTGVAWLTGVGLTTGLAVGLVILGLGFVLGSFVGGSRALIFPALLVGRRCSAITAFIDIPFSGPDRRAALVARLARRAARTRTR